MIRKPEAKAQAELIISDLAVHGLVVKRGHALDLVAKLQGFRGWNEFTAAEKSNQPAAPAPARTGPSGLEYYVPGISGLVGYCSGLEPGPTGQAVITDSYLAAYLKHRKSYVTDIFSTVVEGNTYYLRLCGQIHAVIRESGKAPIEFRSSEGITPDYIRAHEALRKAADPEWLDAPFFEWINEGGDPVGDVFDTISVDPQDEIDGLVKMLKLKN